MGKKLSWPRGDLNPRRWCQSTDMQGTQPSHIPNNDASSPELMMDEWERQCCLAELA